MYQSSHMLKQRNDFKLCDRQVCAKGADPDQAALINTKLNDSRKNICLRKPGLCSKKSNVIETLVKHGRPCSYTNDVIDVSSDQL